MKKTIILIGLLAVAIQFSGCGRPDELDLSETYFPMGIDYEWTYERRNWWYKEQSSNPDQEKEWFDTINITVTDSSLALWGWSFELEGEPALDLGNNPTITGNGVRIFDRIKIDLEPETMDTSRRGVTVTYREDTLWLNYEKLLEVYKIQGDTTVGDKTLIEYCLRLKGIGLIRQEHRIRDYYYDGTLRYIREGYTDRLLWFCIEGDTIWNYEDTISNILF